MEKPLYILIFLLLWSTRIMGGEEGDVNVALSPSTQKNGIKSSSTILDKASTSAITKTTATISDPDSDSSETDSPSNRTETKADTPEPLSSNAFTTKLAKDSTEAKTKTLSDSDSDSPETDSPHIKSEAAKTSNAKTTKGTNTAAVSDLDLESPKTDSAIIKSEAPEHASATSGTKKEEFRSLGLVSITSEAKTAAMRNLYFESQETDSSTIKSEVPETKPASTTSGTKTVEKRNLDDFEPTETDSSSIKPEDPDIKPNIAEAFILNNVTLHPAEVSPEDLHPIEPEDAETNPDTEKTAFLTSVTLQPAKASTATKAKTEIINDPDSDNPEPSSIKSVTNNPSNESSETDLPPYRSKVQYSKTASTTSGKKTAEKRNLHDDNEAPDIEPVSQSRASRSTTNVKEKLATSVPSNPVCNDAQTNVQVADRTSESITLNLTQLLDINTNYLICVQRQHDRNDNTCKPAGQTVTFKNLSSSTQNNFAVFSYLNGSKGERILSNSSCPFSAFTLPSNPVCNDTQTKVQVADRTSESITLNLTQLLDINTNYLICVQSQHDRKDNTCKPAGQTVTFENLRSSTQNNFSVFSYLNGFEDEKILSESSCSFLAFTLPINPVCNDTQTKVQVADRTSESITLNLTQLLDINTNYLICVQRQHDRKDNTCKPAGQTVTFENLRSSTQNNFSVFSYLNGFEDEKILSESSCSFLAFTLPSDPVCNDTQTKVQVADRTSESITLNLTQLLDINTNYLICVQSQHDRNDNTCKPAGQTVTFENLRSSTQNNFSVFSYLNGFEDEKILSESSCLFLAFTLPSNPVCNDTQTKVQVADRTSESITLNLTQLLDINTNYLICVQRQHDRNGNTCKPAGQTVTFKNLISSTQNNFSVFSYLNGFEDERILSNSSCSFSAYTSPADLDCSVILITSTTTTIIELDLRKLRPFPGVQYIAEYKEYEKIMTVNISKEIPIKKVSNLQSGTQYEFDIFAVGEKNIRSVNSCKLKNYTYPVQPQNDSVKIGYKGFYLHWISDGHVDSYNVSVHCNGSSIPRSSHSGNQTTANITGLKPGTHCSVNIIGISGGLQSSPLVYDNIETLETVPGKVSNVNVSKITPYGFTITWGRPSEENGDLRNYNLIVSNGTIIERRHVKISNKEESFYNLTSGVCYSVTIAAVNNAGEGTHTNKIVYTGERIPSNVFNLTTWNTSSTSLSAKWSKPLHPNGVITKYEILVKKEKENKITKNITHQCRNSYIPCPDAESDKEVDNSIDNNENKEEGEGATAKQCNDTIEVNINELEKFTVYSITVTAFTAVGNGTGITSNSRTSEDKPSCPGQPMEYDKKSDSLEISYNKPQFENGNITNQEIELTYISYNSCSVDKLPLEHTEIKKPQIVRNGEKFYASLSGLKPFWEYKIRVRVSTYAGFSDFSTFTTIQTHPTTPNPVTNIIVEQKTSRSIHLSWTQPCHPNGIITNYTIDVTNKTNSLSYRRFTNNNSTSFNVTNLLPYQYYRFAVKTEVKNVSQLSVPQESTFQTSTEAPHPLGNISICDSNSTSVTLSWVHPDIETGPTKYRVTAIDNVTSKLIDKCNTQGFNNTLCSISGLDAYWLYLFVVYVTVEDFPEENRTHLFRTGQSAPGRVSNFTVTQDSNVTVRTNVHVQWSPPVKRDLNGVIKHYFLQFWYQQNQKTTLPFDNTTTKTVVIVKAEEKYTFQVFASTIFNATETDYFSRTILINPGAPLPPPKQNISLINKGPPASDDQTQIAVAFRRAALCDESNGKIIQWYIIVSKTPGLKAFSGARKDYIDFIQKTYKKWEDVYEKDVSIPYIASDSWKPHCDSGSRRKRSVTRETVSYTLGSDGECESGNRKYCNGNLEPGQTYRVRYGVCTAGGCLESEFSEPFQTAPNHIPAIAGSLTAVVLALAVTIVVVIVLKRKGKGPFKSVDNGEVGQQNEGFSGVEMKGISKPKAVKIADFANYVQKLHADSNLLFSSEYKLLKETCPTHTTKAAEVQVNRIKNRYTNILSYDHSRVKLLPTEDDEGSDYINANYMPGFTSPREYIATQGPLPFTRDDFWRMIWEQNVSIIVMLTQLVERGRRKCDIYWPEASREPVYYGDLVVELESESTLPDYVLRVMSIKLGNRVRKVKQLHYLKWPDMGCPETTWLLLNFVGATRLYLPHNDPGPIVVHCSKRYRSTCCKPLQGDTKKTVKQFAYLAWPDMGIPETSEAMLKFAKEVRSHLPPPSTSKGPMVVHCSAGVGRTGTFIAVDYLMQYVRTSDVIDIYSYVMKMRNNRPNMVQTEDQYVFIHDCIKDYVNKNDDDTDDEEEEEETQEDQSIYMNV